jgi:nicotinamide phosphoribosyltransferase
MGQGFLKIELENGRYKLVDQVAWDDEQQGELVEVFRDGKLLVDQTLAEIRARIATF